MVDRSVIKTNQVGIVALVVLAFLFNLPWLVAVVAISLAAGLVAPEFGPFRLLYARALRPAGILRSDIVREDPAPHRFAQGVGVTFLSLAVVLLVVGAATVGWALAWLVVVLAAVNLVFGFCAGCFIHYQLSRRGLLGARRGGAA
jgi:hypothetical protein